VEDGDTYQSSAIDSHSFFPVLKDPSTKFVRPAMYNTNGTCRIGEWKIVVGRKVLQGDVLDKSQVELYNLDEDLSETTDVSGEHPEHLQQLLKTYEEFRSKWTIRPEAVMHREGKSQSEVKRTPPSQASARKKGNADAVDSEYRRAIGDLRKKMEDVFTDEQKQARDVAKKKALKEGKKGPALRAVADAAANLTDEQREQLQNLRKVMGKVTREHRAQQLETSKGTNE
jgi:hypothetical protein